MNEITRTKQPNTRLTIGLLTGQISGELGASFLTGVTDAAEERDANVITFVGGSLHSPHGFEAQGNVLYDLVAAEVVDGLVVDGGLLGHYVGPEAMRDFCKRYRDVPVVSVEVPIEGIPSVLVDFYQGMRDLMTHLIEVHGYRRIAFIRGSEESLSGEDRYRAYQDALAEHDISLDMDLVAPGTFFAPSGEKAIRLLLDERKVEFEALAAANDFMAVDAMQALLARGIRVPGDVAVTGFDDFGVAGAVTPPLTTARLGNDKRAQQAAEMLLAQLEGQEVSERVVRPAELVVRQSCGCPSLAVVEAAPGPVMATGEPLGVALAVQRKQILSEMVEGMEHSAAQAGRRAEQLLDALSAELGGESTGAFLSALDEVLKQTVAAGGDPSTDSGPGVASWQRALSVLRRYALSSLDSQEALARAEDLWQQARVMIGETAERTQIHRRLESEQRSEVLREAGQVLISTHDVAELMDILVEELPQLGIRSCYLSLYEDPRAPADWSRLVLAYSEGERVVLDEGRRHFASRQLVPEGLLPDDRRYQLVIEPLYFREGQIGFALFDSKRGAGQEGLISGALRGQISSALQGALLNQKRQQAQEALEKAYAEVEEKVEERTAELKRETAERERLQQEIIDAHKRALQELSTPIIPVMEGIIVMPLIGSIDTMRARDITRGLLAGIRQHRAKAVILDITGVPIVDSGVANHLNKTIQAARLKGTHTIVTGISDAVAETIVDLGIDWSGIETLSDLQTGLRAALTKMRQRNEG
jgi:DNA-binding LacI/PurR family transcriptional regulator/anti-anti-sigma regulatory factor